MSVYRSCCALAALTFLSLPVLFPQVALADSLTAASGRVSETSHRRDLLLRHHWVDVIDTHVFVADKTEAQAETAVYEFDLPLEAVVTSLTVQGKGREVRSQAVSSDAAIRAVPNATGLDPDRALLREVAGNAETARYQLVLHPVTASEPQTVKIGWRMETKLESSIVSVRIPMRGVDPALKGTALFAKTARGKNHRLSDLRIDGAKALPGKEITFDYEKRTLTVQARLVAKAKKGSTQVSYSHRNVGGNLWALNASVVSASPTSGVARFSKLTILIDISKSMTETGTTAAAVIAKAIIEREKQAAHEIVLFDRTTTQLGKGRDAAASFRTLSDLSKAMSAVTHENGSDLRGAFLVASKSYSDALKAKSIASSGRSHALVVISDGQSSIEDDADALRVALGDKLVDGSIVFAIDIASGKNPLPSPPGGVLSGLILETGGRAFSLRSSKADESAKAIAAKLNPSAQLGRLMIEADGERLDFDLPSNLAVGSGFSKTMLWVGDRPPRFITLTGVRSGKRETVRTQTARSSGAASSFAVRATSPSDLEAAAERDGSALIDGGGEPTNSERALILAGSKVGIVSRTLSLVVIDSSSKFARERMAFAQKWGTELYLRAPTQDELAGFELLSYRALDSVRAKPRAQLRRLVRGGGLDRSTLGRTIRTQLFRPVRHCYEQSLKKNRTLNGTARVRFEISRQEVLQVTMTSAVGLPSKLQSCIVDAGYRLNVPAASGDSDTTYIVNYPFRLRPRKKGGSVDRGSDAVDTSDPLDGL